MDTRLLLICLLAFTGFQVIQAGRSDGGVTTTTSEPSEDEDPPFSIQTPLAESYNMTTQWLGLLRDSFFKIIIFENSQRLDNSFQVALNVRSLSESYKGEMDALMVKDKDRTCVEKNTELGLQVLSTIDEELKTCTQPLTDMIDKYHEILGEMWDKVAAQEKETIYAKCLPSQTKLTREIVERSEKCFATEYRASLDSFYYPTGHHLFSTVMQMAMTLAQLEGTAMSCGLGVLDAHDKVMAEVHEGLRRCATGIALPGSVPHSRVRSKVIKENIRRRRHTSRFLGWAASREGKKIHSRSKSKPCRRLLKWRC